MINQSFRLILSFLIPLSIPLTATVQIVDIPNPNLRVVIEDKLNKAPDAIITVADMATLTELDASNTDISDATGLEAATNLASLEFPRNNVSDISPPVTYAGHENGNPVDPAANPFIASFPVPPDWPFDTLIGPLHTDIPDPNLRAAIEEELGEAPGNTISVGKMETLINLNVSYSNISDLTGLEDATNLRSLKLSGNSLSDISPLAGLTSLITLDLGNNSLSDISPLAELTNLTQLSLRGNTTSDISPLAALTNLTELELGGNSGISDISALAGLTNLISLNLGYTGISDIGPIEGLTKPTKLWLNNNSISDISALAGLTNLTFLDLEDNNIIDISATAGLTKLTELWLEDNSISDISPLVGLTNLTKLRIHRNSISDLSSLVENTGIGAGDYVSVSENFLNALSFNTHIPALQGRGVFIEFDHIILQPEDFAQTVDIPDPNLRAAIADTRGKAAGDTITVADMAILTILVAPEANISDLTGLEAATNLTSLWLWDNNISGISVLSELTNLTELWLQDNSVSDISPLVGLTNLTELRIHRNSISDLSPIVENTGLGNETWINVRGNPLNAPSIITHIPALQGRGVIVEFDDIVAQPADVNGDGTTNIFDMVLVGAQFGNRGQHLATDVNRDGIVDVRDLVLVAGMFAEGAAAPSVQPQAPEMLTAAAVRGWLTNAKALQIQDPVMERGVVVLEQLLISLTPKETKLLSNYPNPFNPETWIPYHLAEDAFVTLTIYDGAGQVVRTIDMGLQPASAYESRSQAIYWDGRNRVGEKVASGVYFYHLSADDYSATRKMLILK